MTGSSSVPTSTYRLQISAAFTLTDAAELVPYLADLGVGALYLSPLLRATHGSVHGYDVVDHSMIDPDRGGEAGLVTLVQACKHAGLQLVLDTVPNHMGVTAPIENPAWWDVLRFGRGSAYASWFDIDWDVADGRILLPILGDDPAAPTPELPESDHYRLVNYRLADTEQNYRRFFAVSGLAALRVEDPNVYKSTHRELLRIMNQYGMAGIRIDHPDGLSNPGQYLHRLREAIPDSWILVEKITQPDEPLPADWPVAGLTGYDALNEISAVLVDPSAESAMTELYRKVTADERSFAEHEHVAKRDAVTTILQAEVSRIVRLVPDAASARDVLVELAVAFPVYRSYLPQGREYLDEAVRAVRSARPDLDDAIDALLPRLTDPQDEVSVRFQQLSGAVMAKGVEDAAFYRYSRLLAFNEVGGNPARFGATLETFHAWQQQRVSHWPQGMTTLSTHDTKRGEDIRARLCVLAEVPRQWGELLAALCARYPLRDETVGYLLWQTAVAMAVGTDLDPSHRQRLHAYLEKAMREAGVTTTWSEPDETFEAAVHRAVDAVFDDPDVHTAITEFAALIEPAAYSNSLAQKLIQLTLPGIPDVYQGSELWEDSLVDPDNRRPVDFAVRAAELRDLDGGYPPASHQLAKLWVTSRALRLRRDRPDILSTYQPLRAEGRAAEHLLAFDRGGAVTLATRLPVGLDSLGGWTDTTITLPDGRYRDEFTGHEYSGTCPVADVLGVYPVALLARV